MLNCNFKIEIYSGLMHSLTLPFVFPFLKIGTRNSFRMFWDNWNWTPKLFQNVPEQHNSEYLAECTTIIGYHRWPKTPDLRRDQGWQSTFILLCCCLFILPDQRLFINTEKKAMTSYPVYPFPVLGKYLQNFELTSEDCFCLGKVRLG